ncbi:ABC transporter permease [Oryzifoliimicrobium ureilyticus]|uniref:ABC transporter permease n=1 Tax=Oryzifoliimicrobium ureilyticus TaxID=3113724 RepID=UPI0030763FD6
MSKPTTAAPQDYETVLKDSSKEVAAFEEQKSALQKFRNFLHASPSAVSLIVLVMSIAIFGVLLGSKFFSLFSLTLILQQVAITGIIGAAQSMVIMTAGIDLSVGAIMVLSSVIMGQSVVHYGVPPAVAVALGFLVGALCGFINGFLISRVKLPPFIVTLGMWQIVLATTYLISANETIRSQDIDTVAPLLHFFGQNIRLGGAVLTYGVIASVILVAVLWYILNHTAWGRYVYALGDDPAAAELSGVNVKKILIQVYVISGIICALAGWAIIGRVGSVSPNVGQFANIESITAVVIGGISLFGGRGSILGMMFGALIVGVFQLGLRLLGTDVQWTYLLIGVLIIAAVAVDQWIRKAGR